MAKQKPNNKPKTETSGAKSASGRRRKATKSCEMLFDHEDVIITDPCYLIRNRKQWLAFVDRIPFDDVPSILNRGKMRMLVADTIFGDWMCSLEGTLCGKKHDFGTFTADAGLVCTCAPGHRRIDAVVNRLPCQCYVVLRKFTGTVRIVHRRGVCHVEGNGRTVDGEVEFTSRQIA